MGHNKSMRGKIFLSEEEIAQLYENEAINYYKTVHSDIFDKINTQYNILTNLAKYVKSLKVPAPLRRNKYIDMSQNKELVNVLAGVCQISVTCHLLQGCCFDPAVADENSFKELARNAVNHFVQAHGENGLRRLSIMLEGVECVRIEKLLRGLGLFTLTNDRVHQLSLGSGSGVKELEIMYSIARVERNSLFNSNLFTFKVSHDKARSTILIDKEPGYKQRYDFLNKENDGGVIALNMDLESALPAIDSSIQNHEIEYRNVVTTFRMDPVMIPDVRGFFTTIKSIINDTTHFLMSIGSGNTVDEFKARIDKMNEIKDYLGSRNMDVFTVKMYTGDSIEECMNKPVFGHGGFSTYEIIYCKILKKKLY